MPGPVLVNEGPRADRPGQSRVAAVARPGLTAAALNVTALSCWALAHGLLQAPPPKTSEPPAPKGWAMPLLATVATLTVPARS